MRGGPRDPRGSWGPQGTRARVSTTVFPGRDGGVPTTTVITVASAGCRL
uniref:Uncharacterized protein n=1 Tax=Nonomuraea gerenzanensis TaxID=93944 RepID=A0A1M4EFC5_9ACTN|nr:hypothetical protein BN4615_P7008 [Nonomuraea gerenzanensis]